MKNTILCLACVAIFAYSAWQAHKTIQASRTFHAVAFKPMATTAQHNFRGLLPSITRRQNVKDLFKFK